MTEPTIGRFVHFYSRAVADRNPNQPGYGFNGVKEGPYSALITQVFRDGEGVTFCNLKVFPPFSPPFDEGSVAEDGHRLAQADRYWEWPPRDTAAMAKADKPFSLPVYVLSSGASGIYADETRTFTQFEANDATTRFAERVTLFDTDPRVSAGWARLEKRSDDVVSHVLGWTKTSDETPTSEGELATADEGLQVEVGGHIHASPKTA